MHRYDPSRQRLALGLAGLAGLVDATGFVVGGGYFTSFMSGNTTRLGVDIVANPALALVPLLIVASFVGGVASGALVAMRWQGRHKRILLGMVTLLLGAAAVALQTSHALSFLTLAAFAMGVSNNVFSRDGEVIVGVTYMTGALVRSGQGLAARLLGRSADSTRGYPLLWLSLAVGAICGAALFSVAPEAATIAAVMLAAGLFFAATKIEGRSN